MSTSNTRAECTLSLVVFSAINKNLELFEVTRAQDQHHLAKQGGAVLRGWRS